MFVLSAGNSKFTPSPPPLLFTLCLICDVFYRASGIFILYNSVFTLLVNKERDDENFMSKCAVANVHVV